jgi:Protein of unknown function (DUF2510)
MSSQASAGQPGWLPDPAGRFDSRYWDGTRWTQAVMRGGEVDTDPEAEPSAPDSAPGRPASIRSMDEPHERYSGPHPLQDPPATEHTVMPHVAPPAATDHFTSVPAAEAQGRLSQMLPMMGVTVTQTTPGRIDGMLTIKDEPNWVVLVLLLLVWIIPGLIYWYLKSRPVTERFSLVFVPVATGTRISIQAGPKVMERLAPMMGQLSW